MIPCAYAAFVGQRKLRAVQMTSGARDGLSPYFQDHGGRLLPGKELGNQPFFWNRTGLELVWRVSGGGGAGKSNKDACLAIAKDLGLNNAASSLSGTFYVYGCFS